MAEGEDPPPPRRRRWLSRLAKIVVGVALLLTGIGLVILAFAVFGREAAAATRTAPTGAQAATG